MVKVRFSVLELNLSGSNQIMTKFDDTNRLKNTVNDGYCYTTDIVIETREPDISVRNQVSTLQNITVIVITIFIDGYCYHLRE